ncbi:hypothetical protein SCOCK_40098 [Actinacidiphila cocklensis]|uniref:Uncharacterized protein n=1 Tax=Actinacidiphila cocklensis TaxID=887465 RepID=A0A9W4DVD8_9ACTN|nr:hypothetical protein SCOCK_40098 [Actinacidiphila cocklensis]
MWRYGRAASSAGSRTTAIVISHQREVSPGPCPYGSPASGGGPYPAVGPEPGRLGRGDVRAGEEADGTGAAGAAPGVRTAASAGAGAVALGPADAGGTAGADDVPVTGAVAGGVTAGAPGVVGASVTGGVAGGVTGGAPGAPHEPPVRTVTRPCGSSSGAVSRRTSVTCPSLPHTATAIPQPPARPQPMSTATPPDREAAGAGGGAAGAGAASSTTAGAASTAAASPARARRTTFTISTVNAHIPPAQPNGGLWREVLPGPRPPFDSAARRGPAASGRVLRTPRAPPPAP